MATEANIPDDESASQKTILEEGFSMTENKSSMELSISNKPPAEYTCKPEHCQADKIESLTLKKLSEDERQHQTGVVSKDVEAGGDKVEAINETVFIEESTHPTEKDRAKVSMQACAEEPMTDQYKSSEVIAESTQKWMIASQEDENKRSKEEEDADLECIKEPASTSETNMGLINEAPLPNLDLTTNSQGEEDKRVEKSCAKDETTDPTIQVEDGVKELSLDGVQKKKDDIPSLLRGECKDPKSIGSSDKLQNDNKENASAINVEESGFDTALKIGDNVNNKLENPYSDQVTDGVNTQVATEARETLQEVASTVCRDKITDTSEDSRINLEKHHEEKRDSQPKNGQEDQLREQVTLIPEETEVAASRENDERRVQQNILPLEEFEESGEKDEPTSTPDSGETSISTEKTPPLAESITKIKGEENLIPQKIANDSNSTEPSVGETGQPESTDISEHSRINLEKHQEEKRDSQPKNGQEDQLGEQVTLIPEETEIAASRENAENRVEQNTLLGEEFEEKGEKDEPTCTPDSGETFSSTKKIPPPAESITKIKGEENMIPQKIVVDLNSTDPLVGETAQPDSTGEVPKTEAREEHQESSKFRSESNEQNEHLSETQSTDNLVVKHMDSEVMVTTETITKLTKDTEQPKKVPDSYSQDEISNDDEKIISEETTEGEEVINKKLFAAESVTEDEAPSRLPPVASARDETIEQSSHEESPKDGKITLIEKNESHRPKDEAEESKTAAEVLDLPNTRGRHDIYEQCNITGSDEETLNTFQKNEKQIQNLTDEPHEEIKGEPHVSDCPPEFIQNTEQEEGYSTATHLYSNPNECSSAESKISADSSSLDKSPTENICASEHQILTKSETEKQHQNEVGATEDKIIEEHHHDIEDDGANISKLGEPDPKVHEEETSIDNKHLDQHLELITDQHATSEVIPASTEKEMIASQTNENTTSKRDEDADVECNQQATSIFEKSCINDDDINTAMNVEDKFKEIISTGLQNEKAGQVRQVDWKDPESIRSSGMSGHENNEEFKPMTSSSEDAFTVTVAPSPYILSVEVSTSEAPSNNEDTDKEKLENPSSSLVADGEKTPVATEAGETIRDASNAICQDNNQYICESVRQEVDVTPVDDTAKAEDLACLNRDLRGEHEEKIVQTELPDNSEESEINPETHNEQEHKVGEQTHLILENTEIEAPRETSISTEKILSLVESISEINNEERMSPQQITNNLNTNDPLVEETGRPDGGDVVTKTDAPEEHQESNELCVEYNKQHEHHPEIQSTENLIVKQVDPIVKTETVSDSIKDIQEIKKFPSPYTEEKIDEDEKIIPEESKEMEEAIDKRSRETAKESISEDQAPSLTTTMIGDEAIEQSTMEESLKDSESTLIEKNENQRVENDAEEKIKEVQASEPSEATGRKDIYDQQMMEGSVEGTMDKFQDNEKEREDSSAEIKEENYDNGLSSEVSQNAELVQSFAESSSLEKLQIERILESEQFQADKAEAINGTSVEEPDHDIEHESAKSSMLASAQNSDLNVHEEETSFNNSSLDENLKVLTDQHASFEVIPESVEKEIIISQTNENPKSKREEDADLEFNEQVTSTNEITLGKISEASLPNLELETKSKSEEDESVIESLTKNEDIETTKHVEDECKVESLIGIQDREAEMAFVLEGEQKDPETIGSSNKFEHENNREEDASTTNVVQLPYVHSVEESISEAASKNGDNDDNNRENSSSNPLIDGASPEVAIEAVETLQEASSTACKDKNKDTCESVKPEEDVPPVDRMVRAEDSAYLDRDEKGANEEDINQAGLTKTIEESIIKTHDGEKRDSLQKNDQEYELGEQAVLIPEKIEEETPREKAEKRIEQNTHSVQKFEEQEKDEPASSPDSGETLILTEKSLPLVESANKINSEETILPQNIAGGLNNEDPLVEDSDNFDIDEIGKETQTEDQEKFEDSSKISVENDKQDEQHSEASSTENLVMKHMYSEEMAMTNTIIKSTRETEELYRVPESISQEKIDIKGDEKIILEEAKEMEESTGVYENEALSRIPGIASVGEEKIGHSFQEESPKDGATMIDNNESCLPENDAEKDEKAVEAFDLPETNGREDISEKQIIEESVEETMKSFQDDEIKIQILGEDTRREIEGKSSVSSLPSELIQHGKTDEDILCESNETVENPEILDMSSKKEEQILFGEYGNPTPKEASIDNQDECAYSMKVDEEKAQLSRQNFESLTNTEGEETCAQLEKFSQKEKKEEEPKDMDGGKENKASPQEVSEPPEISEVSALKPEGGEIESTAGTSSSAIVGLDTRKEYMEEVECDQTKIKEEVEVTESERQIEATSSIERKISNPLDDFSKPKEDYNDVLTIEENNTKGPSSTLGVPKKDSSSTNDSEAKFMRLVNETTAMKEVKPVDVDHEMMDETTSETKSNCLGRDIAERQEAETNSEDKNMEVEEVVDQGEQISHEIEEKDLITGIGHEIEVTTADDQSVHAIIDSSMVPSYGEPKTVEMSKTTENTSATENVSLVETEASSITHTGGALKVASLDNEKGKEYSSEGIKKHNDEALKLESDTGDTVREEREQADSLADLNEAQKLEIVEDEKSTIEMKELTEKTEDSSALTRVEREAAELKTATSGSQEEYLNTKSGELLMEKGDILAKDQIEEILLLSNNIQTEGKDNNLQHQDSRSVQDVPASNLKPRCNDKDLLNSSLDQDGSIDAIKSTHEVYQRSEIADHNESAREHPTEGTITSHGEETENEVEVSTSKFTEQTESTKSTEEKKPLTSDNQTEQNIEITDLRALKSSDASETNTKDCSSTPKVNEKETEASFIKKDDSATDDPKIVPVIVEIEETGLMNSRTGQTENDRGSVIVSENEGETTITTDKTTSDSIDIVGREHNFNSEKEEVLEELNESDLKMDSCVTETEKATTVKQEREQSISTISMSQDYPAPLVEEKSTMGNAKIHPTDTKSTREEIIDEAAETYLVHSIENTLTQKEHEFVKHGGTSDLESVNIPEECSNDDSPQLKNEVNEEKVLVEASKGTTNSGREDSENVQGQDNKGTTLEGNLTNVAIEKEEIALENEPTDELPPEKIVEVADANEKVELAFDSSAEDQKDEKIYQFEEKSECEDNVLKSRENVPNEKIQDGIEGEVDMQSETEHHMSVPRDTDATMLGGCTENVLTATEIANGSENILEQSPEPTSNLKESDTLSTCYETDDKATATNSGFIEQSGEMDLVEERKSIISENPAKANEDFSFTTIETPEEGLQTECEEEHKAEKSNKEDDPHTSESLPCMPERNAITTIDKGAKTCSDTIDTDNIQEERSSSEEGSDKKRQERAEGGREMGQETKDKAPTIRDEPSAMEYAIKNGTITSQTVSNENQHEEKSEAYENRGTEPEITGRRTEVMAQGEKDQEAGSDNSQKEHIDTAELSESTREIQKLQESSLGEVGTKATVKADAKTRETNEVIEEGIHKPDGETKAEVQPEKAKHLDEATDLTAKAQKAETTQCEEAKAESEEDEGVNESETKEPSPSGSTVMVEIPKDGEEKVKHKKSHNILSGVGSKVKHSISKVKKAITGKSSHPKTSSPK
ncbi:hypothetical protein QN277_013732 [Acacia crassicarpa]|uniref:Uncharacterized protein n=1 Tax=Acacia crassicarpa TaxID=499986 RepID=A0AAE1N384_9FABA|nr:hypothetical protein QN277_013732 [Acacia crassicarpa]